MYDYTIHSIEYVTTLTEDPECVCGNNSTQLLNITELITGISACSVIAAIISAIITAIVLRAFYKWKYWRRNRTNYPSPNNTACEFTHDPNEPVYEEAKSTNNFDFSHNVAYQSTLKK